MIFDILTVLFLFLVCGLIPAMRKRRDVLHCISKPDRRLVSCQLAPWSESSRRSFAIAIGVPPCPGIAHSINRSRCQVDRQFGQGDGRAGKHRICDRRHGIPDKQGSKYRDQPFEVSMRVRRVDWYCARVGDPRARGSGDCRDRQEVPGANQRRISCARTWKPRRWYHQGNRTRRAKLFREVRGKRRQDGW